MTPPWGVVSGLNFPLFTEGLYGCIRWLKCTVTCSTASPWYEIDPNGYFPLLSPSPFYFILFYQYLSVLWAIVNSDVEICKTCKPSLLPFPPCPLPHPPPSFLLQEITKREAASRQLSCIQLPVDSSVVRNTLAWTPQALSDSCLSLALCGDQLHHYHHSHYCSCLVLNCCCEVRLDFKSFPSLRENSFNNGQI